LTDTGIHGRQGGTTLSVTWQEVNGVIDASGDVELRTRLGVFVARSRGFIDNGHRQNFVRWATAHISLASAPRRLPDAPLKAH
jgi:hypothetical protein